MKEYGKLVYIGIGLVAILLSYFLGFQHFQSENDTLQSKVDEAQERYDSLKSEYTNKDTYVKQTKEYNKQYEELIGKFDTTLLNEGQIMDLYNLQNECGINITGVTLQEPAETYAFDGSLTDPATVQTTVTNPDGTVVEADPLITTTAIDSSYRGVSNTMTFVATGDYAGIKKMIKSITEGKKRKVLTSVIFTYNSTDEKVSCSATLSEYAITGNDREVGEVKINDKSGIGRDNIFFNPLATATP